MNPVYYDKNKSGGHNKRARFTSSRYVALNVGGGRRRRRRPRHPLGPQPAAGRIRKLSNITLINYLNIPIISFN